MVPVNNNSTVSSAISVLREQSPGGILMHDTSQQQLNRKFPWSGTKSSLVERCNLVVNLLQFFFLFFFFCVMKVLSYSQEIFSFAKKNLEWQSHAKTEVQW